MTRGSRTTSASVFHAPSHARAAVTAASMSISAISSASRPCRARHPDRVGLDERQPVEQGHALIELAGERDASPAPGLDDALGSGEERRAHRRLQERAQEPVGARRPQGEGRKRLRRQQRIDVDRRGRLPDHCPGDAEVQLLDVRLARLGQDRLERLDQLLLVARREQQVLALGPALGEQQRLQRVELVVVPAARPRRARGRALRSAPPGSARRAGWSRVGAG